MKNIGLFNLESNTLLVSDPGYTKDIWCSGKLEALSGTWNVFVTQEIEHYKERKENFQAYMTAVYSAIDEARKVREDFEDMAFDKKLDALKLMGIFPKFDDYLIWEPAERIRTKELIVLHSSLPESSYEQIKEKTDICAAVDSGQCGFYDYEKYPLVPDDRCFEEGPNYKDFDDTWYGQLCNKNTHEAGHVFDSGAITFAGYGDGGYNVYVLRNTDNIVIGAKIIYIGDESDDEEF